MRKKLIAYLFDVSQAVYTKYFKKSEPWGISKKELLTYPIDSYGYKIGEFLMQNGFELFPKVERHDAYHVLTGFGTKVEDEIALQCLCLGNGKKSLYMFGAIFLGIIILPDYLNYYYKAYKMGKSANQFYHFNFKNLLNVNYEDFKALIFTNEQINQLINTQNPIKL